jgi:hypothetical protein
VPRRPRHVNVRGASTTLAATGCDAPVSPAATTTHTLTATDFGRVETEQVVVSVAPDPPIDAQHPRSLARPRLSCTKR